MVDIRAMWMKDPELLRKHSENLFEELDRDSTGSLSHMDIRMMIEQVTGYDPTYPEVLQLIQTQDDNHNKTVEANEFFQLFIKCLEMQSTQEEMESAKARKLQIEKEEENEDKDV